MVIKLPLFVTFQEVEQEEAHLHPSLSPVKGLNEKRRTCKYKKKKK